MLNSLLFIQNTKSLSPVLFLACLKLSILEQNLALWIRGIYLYKHNYCLFLPPILPAGVSLRKGVFG